MRCTTHAHLNFYLHPYSYPVPRCGSPKEGSSPHSRASTAVFSRRACAVSLLRINFVQQLDEVSRHFAHIISGVKAAGKNIFDVKPEAEAKYIELMWKMSPPATGRPSGCTPGYCKLRCPRTSAQLSFLCSGPHSLLLGCTAFRSNSRS